jgi:uncharacterized ion transporter superfamily protein YfcC
MGKRFVEFSVFTIVFSIIYINTLFSLFINAGKTEKVYENKTKSSLFRDYKKRKGKGDNVRPFKFLDD